MQIQINSLFAILKLHIVLYIALIKNIDIYDIFCLLHPDWRLATQAYTKQQVYGVPMG